MDASRRDVVVKLHARTKQLDFAVTHARGASQRPHPAAHRGELLQDEASGCPAVRCTDHLGEVTVYACVPRRISTLALLSEVILSGETVWIRTSDGGMRLAPFLPGRGLSWGYSGGGPAALATLLDRLQPPATACVALPTTTARSSVWRSARTGGGSPPPAGTRRRRCGTWPLAICAPLPATLPRSRVWRSARTGGCSPPPARTRLCGGFAVAAGPVLFR